MEESYMLSLWLVPDDEVRRRLASLIEELAGRLGTPAFSPHVTLLGGMRGDERRLIERGQDLARRLRPVQVRLVRAAHDEPFFRCVFLEAEATPELLGAHQKARRAVGRGPDRFLPHLSLVYGKLPTATRAALVEEVGRRMELPLPFAAPRLELHDTHGAPSLWKLRADLALSGV